MEPAVGFVFSALAYHAGVEHDHVRGVNIFRMVVAQLLQGGGNTLGIGDVHLTAGGPDVILHGEDYNPIRSDLSDEGTISRTGNENPPSFLMHLSLQFRIAV